MTGIRTALSTIVSRLLPLPASRAVRFRVAAGAWPNARNPRGLNEKINWRILHDHRELWAWTCDKLAMKAEVAVRAPQVRLPATLWVGDDIRELDVELPSRWILKSNSGSGYVIPGTGAPNLADLHRRISRWDVDRHVQVLGESAYAAAQDVLFVEEWVGDGDEPPPDIKVFVFDGVPRFITAHTGRFGINTASVYSPGWERLDARLGGQASHDEPVPRPEHLGELVDAAVRIAEGFDFLRVDFFDVDGEVWFGETTPYPWSGLAPLEPVEFELEAGSYWTLPDLRAP